MLDSDEDEEDQSAGNSAVNEREAIEKELFEGDEDIGEVKTGTVLSLGGSFVEVDLSVQGTISD